MATTTKPTIKARAAALPARTGPLPIRAMPSIPPKQTALQKAQADLDRAIQERRQNAQEIVRLKAKAEALAVAEYDAETVLAVARQDAVRAEHNALAAVRTAPDRALEQLAAQRTHRIWQGRV